MISLSSKILNDCFINIGSGIYQEHITKYLKKKKLFVISTDKNSKAKALKFADEKIILGSFDHDKIYEKILKIKKKNKINIKGVITGCTRGAIYTTSFLAKKFKVPALNLVSAKIISNKKNFLKKFNFKIIFKKFNLNKLSKSSFPIVIKDDKFSGAEGVRMVKDKKELLKINISNKNLIYERYVKANHLIATGLVLNSKVVFHKIILKEINKNFTTKKLSYPNNLPRKFEMKISKFVIKKLKDIKFNHGPFSFEIFYDEKKIYCAEIEPSIPGSLINEEILIKCFKINLVDLILKYHLKKKLNIKNKKFGKINIEFFYNKPKFKELFGKKKYDGYNLKLKKINKPDKKNPKKCLYTLTSFK